MDKLYYYPLHSYEDYRPVIGIDDVFSKEELDTLVEGLKSVETNEALLEDQQANHEIRKSNVTILNDEEWSWVYSKMANVVHHVNANNYHKTLYGIEPLQITEYEVGGFYSNHVDRLEEFTPMDRKLSFSIQMTDESEYTGGELYIFNGADKYMASKKLGSVTFFESGFLHRVTPVQSGKRRSLVGWCVGPNL